jgi:hypothetical protein
MPVIPPGFSTSGKTKKRDPIPEAMLTVSLELLAVGLFTLMAGAGPEMGQIMILLMLGFWLIFLITNTSVIARMEKALEVA